MVIVEPFRWIKATALKERLDLANKLNEVIDVLNGGVVTIEDIDLTVSSDGVFTFIFTLSDGAVKEMSFSMGSYINDTVASAISSALTSYATITYVDTKDSENVKKTGVSDVTGDIRVPTTPPNPLSVVNSAYVNDSTDGVNNLLHKSGDEIRTGKLTINRSGECLRLGAYSAQNPLELHMRNASFGTNFTGMRIIWIDQNDAYIGGVRIAGNSNGTTSLIAEVKNSDGTTKGVTLASGDVI